MSLFADLMVRNGRALLAALIMVVAPCSVMADDESAQARGRSIEERFRAIEDEKEIRSLLVLYGQHLDALKLADFSQLFAREGSWAGTSSNFVPVKGPENIQAMLKKNYEGRVYDPKHITNVHVMSNATITVQGDRASGYSRWTVVSRNDKNEPFVRQLGHYEDVYVREDGRWKFLTRVVHRDMP
jgi:hypothetical protein